MTVEFDPRCVTAQHEDCLRILIPNGDDVTQYGTVDDVYGIPYIPVMDTYSGSSNWPQSALVVPGKLILNSQTYPTLALRMML